MSRLVEDVRSSLTQILDHHLPGCSAYLVGSRAVGTSKPYADIDLLLVSPGRLTREARACLALSFEESDIPYKVDVIEADDLSPSFRARLLQDAKPL